MPRSFSLSRLRRFHSGLLRAMAGCRAGAVWIAVLAWLAAPSARAAVVTQQPTYLDEANPFYPDSRLARLTTPQWVGEPGVDAVVILAIDDLRDPGKYEEYLRPILDRLKQIDGRAPVSIFCNALDPEQPVFRRWLGEGLSLEVHTLSHPCPLLAKGNLQAAIDTYHGGVDLLARIPGNRPVAFRMPCCDSMNSPSPRFYAELFSRSSPEGRFLSVDSSIMQIYTAADPVLPREWVVQPDGSDRFRRYIPNTSFVTTIENYPYPYLINGVAWEFPPVVPSDWEAQRLHGTNNPVTVQDWIVALDATVLKQGVFPFIFHPHGWIRSGQLVEFIDAAVTRYGRRVRFLTFREALDRLNEHLLAGHPARDPAGRDHGVRLLDLNADGFMDVVVGHPSRRFSRRWNPEAQTWDETELPFEILNVNGAAADSVPPVQARFGLVRPGNRPSAFVLTESTRAAWTFDGARWTEDAPLLNGLEEAGQPLATVRQGRDSGFRIRDLDHDGIGEVLVGSPTERVVLRWAGAGWTRHEFNLPDLTAFVDTEGRDAGLRFADVNADGFDDVIFSNEERYAVNLYIHEPRLWLGWGRGWSLRTMHGLRSDRGALPPFVRSGPFRNNGAWFRSAHLWIQNEDTDTLPDKVDRRPYDALLTGPDPGPQTPEAALKAFQVHAGFQVQLVAAEPLVQDPVAFDWDLDHNLWVVEMGDYPLGADGNGAPGGKVRRLIDTDGDGRMDASTVFADQLHFPNGILHWGRGVLVSAAPDILYLEDTDGDGRADRRTVLITGFRQGNQQHRVNGFEYGLDGWIYAANGDSGGTLRVVGVLPGDSGRSPLTTQEVSISGRDLRFRPDVGALEPVAGSSQFGRRRDDWGNWFGNNNPNWLWHYAVDLSYIEAHPRVRFGDPKPLLARYPESSRVFPPGTPETRMNWAGTENHVTSACSPAPYRDTLFGLLNPEFANVVFISEPAHSLIHAERLEPDGISFTSRRLRDEAQEEFLSTPDHWFRPTQLRVGPDGTLYVADMYRKVLEHPEYFPEEMKRRPDLRAGAEHGRIYRILPVGSVPRARPVLNQENPAALVPFLDSPNGWVRDVARREIVRRPTREAAESVSRLAFEASDPKTRIAALATLAELRASTPALLAHALADRDPRVLEFAVRLAEPVLATQAPASGPGIPAALEPLATALFNLSDHPSPRVRNQFALSCAQWGHPAATPALAKSLLRFPAEQALYPAVLAGASKHLGGFVRSLFQAQSAAPPPAGWIAQMFELAVPNRDWAALTPVLDRLTQAPASDSEDDASAGWRWTVLGGFLAAIDQANTSLDRFASEAPQGARSAIANLARFREEGLGLARDPAAPLDRASRALAVLGRDSAHLQEDLAVVGSWLDPQRSDAAHRLAIQRLAGIARPEVAELLLSRWPTAGPTLRQQILETWISRTDWTVTMLKAVQAGRLRPAEISPAYRQRLLTHRSFSVLPLAHQLFAAPETDRAAVVRRYANTEPVAGNPARGLELFMAQCSQCHRFAGQGNPVGPDLESMKGKPAASYLVAILDPSQAVDGAYQAYEAQLDDGTELTGLIAAETPSVIRLRLAGGEERTLDRAKLRSLRASRVSLMPDGLEAALAPPAMADLLSYLLHGGKAP